MRKNIFTAIALFAILLGSFSFLLTSAAQARASSNPDGMRDSKFHAAKHVLALSSRMTSLSRILSEPPAQPTPTATQAIPVMADPTVILTLAGVIGAFVAVLAMLFALRGKGSK